ncbi:hypothetical protein PAPYR_9020 [Paratrimastix pyriformis]|uniref:U-box domain-containing protein n=1 Tax=Paratrimastix pyriformis TaxID=342808 RepID=A0ABQ8U9E1_9EUKA|nr:hypothetical protein PAPYR_9020 [Paratrimastix pyriformis]
MRAEADLSLLDDVDDVDAEPDPEYWNPLLRQSRSSAPTANLFGGLPEYSIYRPGASQNDLSALLSSDPFSRSGPRRLQMPPPRSPSPRPSDGPTHYTNLTSTQLSCNGPVPSPRRAHCACTLNGGLVIFGGSIRTGPSQAAQAVNDLWQLSPEGHDSFRWHQLLARGPAPSPRHYHSGIAWGESRLVVYGGSDLSASPEFDRSCWIYDAEAHTWAERKPNEPQICPPGRRAHSAVFFDSPENGVFGKGEKMIVFGGWDCRQYFDDLLVYDLARDVWCQLVPPTPLHPRPSPRASHSACVVGTDMFVFGGILADSSYTAELWVLDLVTGHWTRAGSGCPLPLQPVRLEAEQPPHGRPLEEEVLQTDLLEPAPRAGHRMVALDGRNPVVVAGRGREGRFGDAWMYLVSQNLWLPLAPPDTFPRSQCASLCPVPAAPDSPSASGDPEPGGKALLPRGRLFGGDLGATDTNAVYEFAIGFVSPLVYLHADRAVTWEASCNRGGLLCEIRTVPAGHICFGPKRLSLKTERLSLEDNFPFGCYEVCVSLECAPSVRASLTIILGHPPAPAPISGPSGLPPQVGAPSGSAPRRGNKERDDGGGAEAGSKKDGCEEDLEEESDGSSDRDDDKPAPATRDGTNAASSSESSQEETGSVVAPDAAASGGEKDELTGGPPDLALLFRALGPAFDLLGIYDDMAPRLLPDSAAPGHAAPALRSAKFVAGLRDWAAEGQPARPADRPCLGEADLPDLLGVKPISMPPSANRLPARYHAALLEFLGQCLWPDAEAAWRLSEARAECGRRGAAVATEAEELRGVEEKTPLGARGTPALPLSEYKSLIGRLEPLRGSSLAHLHQWRQALHGLGCLLCPDSEFARSVPAPGPLASAHPATAGSDEAAALPAAAGEGATAGPPASPAPSARTPSTAAAAPPAPATPSPAAAGDALLAAASPQDPAVSAAGAPPVPATPVGTPATASAPVGEEPLRKLLGIAAQGSASPAASQAPLGVPAGWQAVRGRVEDEVGRSRAAARQIEENLNEIEERHQRQLQRRAAVSHRIEKLRAKLRRAEEEEQRLAAALGTYDQEAPIRREVVSLVRASRAQWSLAQAHADALLGEYRQLVETLTGCYRDSLALEANVARANLAGLAKERFVRRKALDRVRAEYSTCQDLLLFEDCDRLAAQQNQLLARLEAIGAEVAANQAALAQIGAVTGILGTAAPPAGVTPPLEDRASECSPTSSTPPGRTPADDEATESGVSSAVTPAPEADDPVALLAARARAECKSLQCQRELDEANTRRAVAESLADELDDQLRRLKRLVPDEVPPEFCCPITQEIMSDCVVASDGETYERVAITRWLQQNARSPLHGTPMSSGQLLFPNRSLWRPLAGLAAQKRLIDDFKLKYEPLLADGGDLPEATKPPQTQGPASPS